MPTAQDAPDQLRAAMVDALVRDGHVRSPLVIDALRNVPRHAFVPLVSPASAYERKGIPLEDASGQAVSSLSDPAWVAVMLEELALEPGMKALEIGAGTGYHSALVAHIVGNRGHVHTVEIEPWLVERARSTLERLRVPNVTVIEADGALGLPDAAPFDRILLTTGTWDVFPTWIEQLAPDGHFVAPIQFAASDAHACIVFNLAKANAHLRGRACSSADMVPMRSKVGGAAREETTREGSQWRPSAIEDLRSVAVYTRDHDIEPGPDQKVFTRAHCQIVLERATGQ